VPSGLGSPISAVRDRCFITELHHAVNITEVRIKLVSDLEDRLRAFCLITIDDEFVVRDLKIIEGPRGFFVAMPSRKITEKCTSCGFKNEVRARYCSNCGRQVTHPVPPANVVGQGIRTRQFADIAHPINADCRDRIEKAVLASFHEERERARQPDYVCRYDEFENSR
jgi:stage V sporulation protein G